MGESGIWPVQGEGEGKRRTCESCEMQQSAHFKLLLTNVLLHGGDNSSKSEEIEFCFLKES